MKQDVLSPLTKKKAVYENSFSAKWLAETYLRLVGIDVTYLLAEHDKIEVYRCPDTQYRFYFPFDTAGDGKFYNILGLNPWYYLPWKWEHEEALKHINQGDRVLEVGAAKGDFLKRVQSDKSAVVTGLELSDDAVSRGLAQQVPMVNQSVEEFSISNRNQFDVVCSFQVLEHIPNVGEVLRAMIDCLRPGGKLIISVPNNQSYLKDNPLPSRVLNMPPHHMGLWDKTSLENLTAVFPLDHKQTVFEPLQDIHADTYQYTKVKRLLRIDLLVRIYWKLKLHKLVRTILLRNAQRIVGHSIFVVFSKRAS